STSIDAPVPALRWPSRLTSLIIPSVGAASRNGPPSSLFGYATTAFIATSPLACTTPDTSSVSIRVVCSGRVGASHPATTNSATMASPHPPRPRGAYEKPNTVAGNGALRGSPPTTAPSSPGPQGPPL